MGDMQTDSDIEMDGESSNFVFSRPNVIPSPDKIFNSVPHSDKIFGERINQHQEASAFTFAKPAAIEKIEHDDNFKSHSNTFLNTRISRTHKLPLSTEKFHQKRKEISHSSSESSSSRTISSSLPNSPFSATQSIKKTAAFTQLEKNSRKKSDNKEVRLKLDNSVTCLNVPDSLFQKSVAKEYFEKYGEILKITVKPRRKMIVVYYSSKESAEKAYYKAGKFSNQEFKIQWTTPELLNKPKKKESIKGKIASILKLDDEVKEELEAMRGLEYNLPDPQNSWALSAAKAKVKKAARVVANKEAPKKTIPLIAKPFLKSTRIAAKLDNSLVSKVDKSVSKVNTPVSKIDKPVSKTDKSISILDKIVIPRVEVPITHQNIPKISSTAIEEMQSQIRQAGTTSEEKYKILDVRDKLMRLKRSKLRNLATAKITKGTCFDMCPEKERYMREFQRQLSTYEQLDTNDYKINHRFAVKQYSRSSADQEEPMAHDLRPLKSLKMTMSYLLHEIADLCDREDANLTEWYHFLWDRMRSVRKDITQQELCCTETVELVEQCARFHILSSERLCAEDVSVFDPKINSENLTKCLQTLKYMYHDLRESGINCQNEPEFRAYVILLNLNNGTFISELSTLPPSVQHSPGVKLALEIYSAIAMNNYVKFFKLVRKTTYLNGCILMRYFSQVRIQALKVMVKAYCRTSGSTEYPLYELIDILGFEDEDEVFDFCNQVGLKCDRDSLYIKLNKESFHMPENNIEQGRAYNLVLSKRMQSGQSVGQCIAGGLWPEKFYENHKPHSSFDDRGFLLRSSINAQDQNLARDPYEFLEEDDDMEFVNESKSPVSASNNLENKKPFNNDAMRSIAEFPMEPRTSTSTDNIFPLTSSVASAKPKSLPSNFFTPASSTASSIFGKPATTVFSAIPTKPSVLPTNSSFAMTVNKSIFSGNSQTNLFKMPAAGTDLQMNFKQDTSIVVSGTNSTATAAITTIKTSAETAASSLSTSTERVTAKRRLEDPVLTAEKKALTEKEELLRKELELKRKLIADLERSRMLERINKQSLQIYEELKTEVVSEHCAEISRDELNLLESLSNEVYEKEVGDMCETILREQLFIQDTLMEVESRLRDRLIMKYYRIWKQWAARRRAQRREALNNTPVWLQPDSLEECARKLYRPEQRIAIKYAIECRKRKSWPVEEDNKKGPKHAPIEYVIYVGLKENAKSLDNELPHHNFWKLVISWPFLENRLTLWRHKKLVNKYLSPADPTMEPIIIRHKPSSMESLDICIRYFEGLISENCIIGMDALLFVVGADENENSIERRLSKAVLSRDKLVPIPLVIVIFGDESQNSKSVKLSMIENLLESGHVSEYSILYENSVDDSVVLKIFQSAILWLVINRSSTVPLEMDYLNRIFNDCLTEELWLRIQSHLSQTSQLSKALQDPNFVINLHNEAITHMKDIILDSESMAYTDFAPELKIFLNNKRTYPCTYEHFDSVWKYPEYRAELERIMNSFIFPPWKDDWPIRDTMNAYDAIIDYCRQIISYDSSIPVTNNIMSDMFLMIDESEDSYSSFVDVLLHILIRKISNIGGNTRVVYNKNHIKHFQTLPWWFRSNTLLNYVAQNKDEEEEYSLSVNESHQNISVTETQMDFDEFEGDINELNETTKQLDEEQPIKEICDKTRDQVTEIENTAEKFEKDLAEQLSKNHEFEEKLLKALQDDDPIIDV